MKTICFVMCLCLFSFSFCSMADGSALMDQTNDVNHFINSMVMDHEAAFISSCNAYSGSTKYLARIVFFPQKNQGLFVFSDKNGVVLNYGSLDWTPGGKWDMSDLEGGIETIKISSDLFYKVTYLPFKWASPDDVKAVYQALPENSCEMLKR